MINYEKGCKTFVPSPLAAQVCTNCLDPLIFHYETALNSWREAKQAIVEYILENGGIKSYYGGVIRPYGPDEYSRGNDAWEQSQHIKDCGIDWDKTPFPAVCSVNEFAGTNVDYYVDVVVCEIACNCDEMEIYPYKQDEDFWSLPDSMTQLDLIAKGIK